jgi:carbon-monoxide dehydrogenase medium subunit
VDISTVAVLLAAAPDRRLRHRVALLSVAPTPLRVPEAERVLDAEGVAGASRAAEAARQTCAPISDARGSAEYRRAMVGVLLERGVRALHEGETRRGGD